MSDSRTKHLLLVVAIAFGLASCGATLRLSATAPNQDNAGSCTIPSLVTMGPNPALWMHFAWTGPQAGQDSVLAAPGQLVQYSRGGLPAGSYTVRAWARDAGGDGCDTSVAINLKNPPWRPRF